MEGNIFNKLLNPQLKKPQDLIQTFDSDPIDAQLTDFLDFEGTSFHLKITETPHNLIVAPGTIPIWFALICILIPIAFLIWFAFTGRIEQSRLVIDNKFFILFFSLLAAGGFVTFTYLLNRSTKVQGDYFIFDKKNRTLTLPRCDIKLRHEQIHSFFLLSSYQKGHKGNLWAFELSVFAKTQDNKMSRLLVVIDSQRKRIEPIAKKLSEAFNVPLRTLKLDKKTRQALRTSSNVNT